jgi:hypothetical protein
MIRPWKVFLSVAVGAALLPCSAMAQTPTISITSPGGSGIYTLNEVVNAAYTCTGAATCVGTVPNGAPLDTGSLGVKNFSVTATAADGATATSAVAYQVMPEGGSGGPGDVPATLNLDLGTPSAFAPFIPGIGRDYTSTVVATITSTAEDNLLMVADASSTNVGRMVNGAFPLAQPVQVGAVKSATDAPTFAPLGGTSAPTPLLTFEDPVSNAAAHVTFKQPVAATDPLRTGSYSKTLTFTVSTTNP